MRRPSVADDARTRQRQDVARLTPGERVRLALELGSQSLELLRSRRGISLAEARASHERQRQRQRRRSACVEALLA